MKIYRKLVVALGAITVNAVVYATLVVPAGSPFRIETGPPACA